jgi:carbon monoxide dehydrogenase subunit G
MIDLRRVIDLSASPTAVWAALWDVPALARCIPGCADVEVVDEGRRYRATIRDRVGPFTITIPLEVLVESAPPGRLEINASGRDSALGSPVTVGLTVTLAAADGGGTQLSLAGRGDVGGKLATLGQGLIQRKTKDILDRFATNLTELVKGRSGAPAV